MRPGTAIESAIPRRSLTSAVADKLRDQIIRGEIPEGAQPRQDAIATQSRISRNPVREALRQLIAGLTAAGQASQARNLFRQRERLLRFARSLDQTFRLRSKLRSLPSHETIICRCEDVRDARLRRHTSWRSAKLQTRCGMGPCQGRVCAPATDLLFKWDPESTRPPIFPVRVECLAFSASQEEPRHHA